MAKFKKKKKANPAISTASLPDIVFMLLFFFMVSTVLREQDLMVMQRLPQAEQLQAIEKKSLATQIYVGKPKEKRFGVEPRIQVNDVFIDPNGIPRFIQNERSKMAEKDHDKIIISLKVDRQTKMGIISDIKQQLREVNARILYLSSSKRAAEE
ncbi:ExbD/TolR family protein [Eisenibacter elegans]|jgi:biopolymer transport protein ExbD|uniref:ExbD/TolR family protein n=1 Tax=Eisenibacter elegans TaxID=997 RepID=UPI00042445C4|nr:biopolymer transporter ExbD [Eisenibacter elegans]